MDALDLKTSTNTDNINGGHIDQNWSDIQERVNFLLTEHANGGSTITGISINADGGLSFELSTGAILGPVQLPSMRFVMRDEWAPETLYGVGDLITIDGSSFGCRIEHLSGDDFQADRDALYWQLIAQGATPGSGGGGGGSPTDRTICDPALVVSYSKQIGAILIREASVLQASKPVKATLLSPIVSGGGKIEYKVYKHATNGALTDLGTLSFTGGGSRHASVAIDATFAADECLSIMQEPRADPPAAGYFVASIPLLPAP